MGINYESIRASPMTHILQLLQSSNKECVYPTSSAAVVILQLFEQQYG